MAQNITLLGASYSDVPSVVLPKTGGGTALFADPSGVTAAAADVASGKYFLDSAGNLVAGTASGGSATLITKSITANGTYDASDDSADGYSQVTVNVSGGGGASNVVTGEFTAAEGSWVQTRSTVTIPYTGSGYPVAAMIYVKNGAYNQTGAAGWYDGVKRYTIGFWAFSKCNTTSTPSFSGSESDNGVVMAVYKNSSSSANNYSRNSIMNATVFGTSDVGGSSVACIQFKGDAKTLQYYIGNGSSTSYGLFPGVQYVYHIIYSS